jgi:hypothetical protein
MTTDHVQSGMPGAADQDGGRLLRQSLKLDAAASGALGVLLAAGGAVLDELLDIPAEVLVPVGGFLVVYAASLWFLGTRARVSRPAVWMVVVGNLLWAAASVVAAAAGWWSPTATGIAVVLAQAAAVVVFAELQFTGLRRSRAAA